MAMELERSGGAGMKQKYQVKMYIDYMRAAQV
jgi:hypothetical protein